MLKPLHQGISVPDMDAAIAWYSNVFGFEKISDDVEPMLNSRVVFLHLDGFELELFQYLGTDAKPMPEERKMPNDDLKTCGTKHVAYAVDDLEALYRSLVEKQVDVAVPPFPMHRDLVCFIRDNSGVLIELIERNALENAQ